jgi:AcrR family transcriptional regulator
MNRAAKEAATRAAILTAATTVFKTLGYDRATLRDIANTAGHSTGAIYSQWERKRALYIEAMGHPPATVDQLRDVLDEAPILSKYHGMRGFEADRFITDYEAWRSLARVVMGRASGGVEHASDCAVHNEPAYPAGHCNCRPATGCAAGRQAPERPGEPVRPRRGRLFHPER